LRGCRQIRQKQSNTTEVKASRVDSHVITLEAFFFALSVMSESKESLPNSRYCLFRLKRIDVG